MKNFLIFLILILLSCNNKSHDKVYKEIKIDVNKSKEGLLSDIYSDINYIFLDNTDNFPLIRPVKVIIKENLIGIEDRGIDKYVFYNLKGNPLFQITASGDGPKSFVRTEDFQILKDEIVVKDSYLGKILSYDLTGDFISERKSPVRNSNFFQSDDFTIHYSKNVFEHGPYNFYIERNGDLKKEVKVELREDEVINSDKDGFYIDLINNQILFKIPFSYQIATFDFSGVFKNLYQVDFGEFKLSVEERLNMNEKQINDLLIDGKIVQFISSFYPIKNGYFLSFGVGIKEFHQVLLDKNFNVVKHYKSFKNDIDELPIRTIPWFSTIEQIGYLMSSTEFLTQYSKKFSDNKQPDLKTNLYKFYINNKRKLNSDSYVLILLKIRDDF